MLPVECRNEIGDEHNLFICGVTAGGTLKVCSTRGIGEILSRYYALPANPHVSVDNTPQVQHQPWRQLHADKVTQLRDILKRLGMIS